MAVLEGGGELALEQVLSLIAIGGVEVKNRVVRTVHGTSMGYGDLSDALIDADKADLVGMSRGHAAAQNL